MADLTVAVVAGAPYFNALWAKPRRSQKVVIYWLSEKELRRKLAQSNQRALAIAPYRIGDVTYFAALFDVGANRNSAAGIGLTAAGLARRDRIWRRQGYTPTHITAQPRRPGRFFAVWRSTADVPTCERQLVSDGSAPRPPRTF